MNPWLIIEPVVLNSGRYSSFKIEFDHITNEEIYNMCALLTKVLPPFGDVAGVPTGGLRVER